MLWFGGVRQGHFHTHLVHEILLGMAGFGEVWRGQVRLGEVR